MPNATPEEIKAANAWQMRAALNVMAMQCQFEPTLVAASSYRAILVNHRVELAKVYAVMNGYFNRVGGSVRAGQTAMDKYDTKNYSAFSAVAGQLEFCTHTSRLAAQAAYLPVGQFTQFANDNLQSTYASLKPVGDLYFYTVMARVPVEQDVIPAGRKRR